MEIVKAVIWHPPYIRAKTIGKRAAGIAACRIMTRFKSSFSKGKIIRLPSISKGKRSNFTHRHTKRYQRQPERQKETLV